MIRKAVVDDFEEIHKICEMDLGYICDKELLKERLEEVDPARECVLVGILDAKVVGFIHVERYEVLYAESMCNVLGLAVAKDYRRRGVGKELLHEAEKWAMAGGISMMRLNSGITRKEAHLFYRNNGYGSEKEQLRFIKEIQ